MPHNRLEFFHGQRNGSLQLAVLLFNEVSVVLVASRHVILQSTASGQLSSSIYDDVHTVSIQALTAQLKHDETMVLYKISTRLKKVANNHKSCWPFRSYHVPSCLANGFSHIQCFELGEQILLFVDL